MTENAEKIPTPEEELEMFRDTIVGIAEAEAKALGSEQSKSASHFGGHGLERDKISMRDKKFFEKIDAGTVTREDVEEYRAGMSEDMKREVADATSKSSLPTSTEALVHGYLVNMASAIVTRKELEEKKKKK